MVGRSKGRVEVEAGECLRDLGARVSTDPRRYGSALYTLRETLY